MILKKQPLALFLPLCVFFTILPFLAGSALADSEKSFYITPGMSFYAEESDVIESFIQTTVTLDADPTLVAGGKVTFPGIQIPVIPAELEYDEFDGGAIIFGWKFYGQFALELLVSEPRVLGAAFDIPVQTIFLSSFITGDTLQGIGNTNPGELTFNGVVGELADFELLELAIGVNYEFSVSDRYVLFMGVGIIGYVETDTTLKEGTGLDPNSIKSDFESDADFYVQAGFKYPVTENFLISVQVKQISLETEISFSNLQLQPDSLSGTTATSGDLKTEFDISGNLFHVGLQYSF